MVYYLYFASMANQAYPYLMTKELKLILASTTY